MLTSGEFVIRKNSVRKIGADNLARMNATGFAAGGQVVKGRHGYGPASPTNFDNVRRKLISIITQ